MQTQFNFNLFIIQIVIILMLLCIVIWFLRLNRTTTLEKRYKRFCIDPLNNDEKPFLDKIKELYYSFRKKLSIVLSKSDFLRKYSKRYNKYLDKSKIIRESSMDYVSSKFIWGFICILIIILSDVFRYSAITFMQLLTVFLIGFFVPDIFWKSREKYRKLQIEKDMLKAIIIMNNSFKSGLSIMQAIYMVSDELEGPISDEFRKMYIDISFGLDMDMVFERFAKRVNTEEARYITTSLSVLNKTGGNIVQVFASVERNAFTRKKLKEELGALASSAKAIYRILVAIPPLLSGIILLLNPNYFKPLFNTTIGMCILLLILFIYIAYIIIIKRIVEMKG